MSQSAGEAPSDKAPGGHYFITPGGPERRRVVAMRFWDTDWDFETAAGVFSADRLDPGTAVLLRECVPPSLGQAPGPPRFLDLGCGYGVIATALAVGVPTAEVDAVDVNERALALCAANAARHLVADRVHPLLPDQADPAIRYDEIWSNPPIRIGKAALRELLLTWLGRLTEHGVARLVVSKNLGADSLQKWLVTQGWLAERSASAKGYRVLSVFRP
ncbi:MAG: methyltransferase [Propionibacteriaceae bacterium]|jgi:16S rRNA G1207 methylase RsmC|nr:methyltransferase [Propionibacteriaceae bacterium]